MFQKRDFYTGGNDGEEMMETNLKYLEHWNKETGNTMTPDEVRPVLRQFLSTLKRWHHE